MKSRLMLSTACLLASTPGLAQGVRAKAKEVAPATYVAADVGTGLGIFQDIQVPVNTDVGTRADGTVAQSENANHSGFPLWVGIGALHQRSRWTLDGGFDLLQMRATSGPAETQSSSYSRLELGLGAAYSLPVSDSRLVFGTRLIGRRSSFMNVSSGHYISSILVRASFGWATDERVLEVFGAMAPSASFGYDKGGGFGLGGDAFRSSKTSMIELGAKASFHLRDRVWFDLGAEQESAQITIDDVASEYAGFGLTVTPQEQRGRVYDLATVVARIGVRREF